MESRKGELTEIVNSEEFKALQEEGLLSNVKEETLPPEINIAGKKMISWAFSTASRYNANLIGSPVVGTEDRTFYFGKYDPEKLKAWAYKEEGN